jgi:hypothetical protein
MKQVYFEDLTHAGQISALNEYRDINLHDKWWLDVFDRFQDFGVDVTYYDGMTANIELYLSPERAADEILKELDGSLNDLVRLANNYKQDGNLKAFIEGIEQELTRWLGAEEDYLTSDEAVAKTLIDNDIKFYML